ncbi:MAG TPA: GNAT family N-acetyltransferase [Cyclobacteriaceae bacterium]
MDYIIRDCEPHDLPALIKLCINHAAYERAEYDPAGKLESLKVALFSEPKALNCWVVEINNQLSGYCSYTFDYSTWNASRFIYMDCLYLEPECRSKGIGEEIIKRLKQVASDNGGIKISWQTPSFNERAIKFYRRMGTTEKEKVRFYL